MNTPQPRNGRPGVQPARVVDLVLPDAEGERRPTKVCVRRAINGDVEQTRTLLVEGAGEGMMHLDELDTALAELHPPADGELPRTLLWVADHDGSIVGVSGLRLTEPYVVAVRWLRVSTNHRRCGIGRMLLQESLHFCQRTGLLKVVLEIQLDRIPVVELFRSLGFQLNRERERNGVRVLEFYLDLYRDPHL